MVVFESDLVHKLHKILAELGINLKLTRVPTGSVTARVSTILQMKRGKTASGVMKFEHT